MRQRHWRPFKFALLASTCGLCFDASLAYALSASNLTASTSENTPVNINLDSGITPDSGYTPTVSIASGPAHGTVTFLPDSDTVTYTPTSGFSGTDSFTYTAFESPLEEEATATVTITVSSTAFQPPDGAPMPGVDPSVIGTVNAMQQSMLFTSDTQIQNFNRRLNDLLNGAQGLSISGLNLFGLPLPTAALAARPDPDARLVRQAAAGDTMLSDAGSDSGPWRRVAANDGTSGGGSSVIELPDRVGIFLNGIASVGDFNGTGSQYGSGLRNLGVSAGIDYRFTKDLVLGIGGGYTASSVTIGDGSKTTSDEYNLTLYGTDRPTDNIYIDGLANIGRIGFTTNRVVAATGAMAQGEPSGSQFSGSLTGGYEFAVRSYTFGPYLRLNGSHTTLPSFSEDGAGSYDVSYSAQTVDSLSGVLGVRGDDAISTAYGIFSPHLRVEYEHEFMGGNPVGVEFSDDSSGASLGMIQNQVSHNYVTIGGGASFLTEGALAAFVDYETILGYSHLTYHTFTIGITKRF